MCGLWFVSNGVAVETWLVLWSGMELYGWYGCRVVVARCVLVCACERRVGWSVVGVYRSEWCQRRDEKRVVSRSYVSKVADQRSRGK